MDDQIRLWKSLKKTSPNEIRSAICLARFNDLSVSISNPYSQIIDNSIMKVCKSKSVLQSTPSTVEFGAEDVNRFCDMVFMRLAPSISCQSSTTVQSSLMESHALSMSAPASISNDDITVLADNSRKRILDSTAPQSQIQPTVQTSKNSSLFSSAKDQFLREGGKLPQNSVVEKKTIPKTNGGDNSSSKSNLPEELQHLDPDLVLRIEQDIVGAGQAVLFKDIAGLEFAKRCVQELVCWPMTRPDLFTGLRALPRGLLLFGPPGTGKTLIGKAIAHEAGATFFSISASSLTSKWIGEGEKTVKTLFAVAVYRQPAVVFIDEVDSLLCQRSSDENEASRRMKTEFLVQLDGAGTNQHARVVVLGATNRPDELDEAARRRFVKRIYIPLPDVAGRQQLFETLLTGNRHSLSNEDMLWLVDQTSGFSGADIRSLCNEAALGPVRELANKHHSSLANMRESDVSSIQSSHFICALETVSPSVSPSDLQKYLDWNASFGSFRKIS